MIKSQTVERLAQLRDESAYMAKVATKVRNEREGIGDLTYPDDPTDGEVLYLCAQLLTRVSDVLHDTLTELGDACDE